MRARFLFSSSWFWNFSILDERKPSGSGWARQCTATIYNSTFEVTGRRWTLRQISGKMFWELLETILPSTGINASDTSGLYDGKHESEARTTGSLRQNGARQRRVRIHDYKVSRSNGRESLLFFRRICDFAKAQADEISRIAPHVKIPSISVTPSLLCTGDPEDNRGMPHYRVATIRI